MAASPWSAGTSAVTLPSAQLRDGAAETGRQWIVTSADDVVPLSGGGRSVVHRRGNVVIRDAGPWTPAVHALLRHLEDAGFAAAPRLVGSGLATDGREALTFIDGRFTQPGPRSLA